MAIAAVIADQPVAAKANREAISAAAGTVALPAGKVYVDEHVRHEKKQGLEVIGYGTTLYGADPALNSLIINGHEGNVTYNEPPVPGLGWLYEAGGKDHGGFYRGESKRFQGPVPPLTPKLNAGKNVFRGFPIADARSGRDGITLEGPDATGLPPVAIGDAVKIADGAGIDEIAPSEWAVVTSVAGLNIFLDRKLSRTYKRGQSILIAGDWPRDITYRGLTFDGAAGMRCFLAWAFRVSFYDCDFPATQYAGTHYNTLDTTGCGELLFERCRIPCGIRPNSSQITFRYCELGSVDAEEFCQRVVIDHCLIYPRQLDSKVGCSHWIIRHSDLAGNAHHVYDNWQFHDNRIIGPGDCFVRGYNATLKRIVSDRPIAVQSQYQGCPSNAGKSVHLENIIAPAIVLETGTSGTILNCTAPVHGDKTNWSIR